MARRKQYRDDTDYEDKHYFYYHDGISKKAMSCPHCKYVPGKYIYDPKVALKRHIKRMHKMYDGHVIQEEPEFVSA